MAAAPSTRVSTTVRQDSGGTVAASAAARATVVESQEGQSLGARRAAAAPAPSARRAADGAPLVPRVGGASEQPTTLYAAAAAALAAGRNSPSRRHSPEAVRQSEARRYRNIATGRLSRRQAPPLGASRARQRLRRSDVGGRPLPRRRGGGAVGARASAISVGPERETTRASRRAPSGLPPAAASLSTAGGARGSVPFGLPPRNPASRWLANEEDRHSLDGFI